jgi:hypothetical protein
VAVVAYGAADLPQVEACVDQSCDVSDRLCQREPSLGELQRPGIVACLLQGVPHMGNCQC